MAAQSNRPRHLTQGGSLSSQTERSVTRPLRKGSMPIHPHTTKGKPGAWLARLPSSMLRGNGGVPYKKGVCHANDVYIRIVIRSFASMCFVASTTCSIV